MDYAFARYYNSRLGRFMGADPLGGSQFDPQTLNRYAYVRNNPTSFIDPIGLRDCQNPPRCTGDMGGASYPGYWVLFVDPLHAIFNPAEGISGTNLFGDCFLGDNCILQFVPTIGGDPVGGQPCTLNIKVNNNANLSPDQLSALEGRMASIFGNTGSPVGVNFSFPGSPDATLNITNASWFTNFVLGSPLGVQGGFWGSPTVYLNNFPANIATPTNLGGVGAHEIAHQFLGRDLPFDQSHPNLMMFDNAPVPVQADALSNPNSDLWKLSPRQASGLLVQCLRMHPQGN